MTIKEVLEKIKGMDQAAEDFDSSAAALMEQIDHPTEIEAEDATPGQTTEQAREFHDMMTDPIPGNTIEDLLFMLDKKNTTRYNERKRS